MGVKNAIGTYYVHKLLREGRLTREPYQDKIIRKDGKPQIVPKFTYTWHSRPVPTKLRSGIRSTRKPPTVKIGETADKPGFFKQRDLTKFGPVEVYKPIPELPMSTDALRQLDELYFEWVGEDTTEEASKIAAVAEFRNFISKKTKAAVDKQPQLAQ